MRMFAPLVLALVCLWPRVAPAADTPAAGTPAAAPTGQTRFKTPTAAIDALIAAVRANDKSRLIAVLGPDAEAIGNSGDPVENANDRRRFVALATERTRFETLPDGSVVAQLGRRATPFAIPLVKDGDGWRFDTAAGKDELISRRIGRDELDAIATARAYVDAQEEYARRDPMKNGVPTFAQQVRSTPGKYDGLYWDATGSLESPLGPLFAEAAAEGYDVKDPSATPRPFHGYYFRILTSQGANATGGAKDYVKDGKMTGGYALVAWPAEYGQSGIMTFLVNQQGVVFEKDLGPQTAETVKAMTAYDPDRSWRPAR